MLQKPGAPQSLHPLPSHPSDFSIAAKPGGALQAAQPPPGSVGGGAGRTPHDPQVVPTPPGTYLTHEAKGSDDAPDADTAIINAEGGQAGGDDKKEYFI